MQSYDDYLAQEVENYENSLCYGEPKVVDFEKQYEPDGYSIDYIYNCQFCKCSDCKHWKDYNNDTINEG